MAFVTNYKTQNLRKLLHTMTNKDQRRIHRVFGHTVIYIAGGLWETMTVAPYKNANGLLAEIPNVFHALKSDSHLPKKIFFICFNDRSSKMMKNAFYFILKALFLLKIFKLLS